MRIAVLHRYPLRQVTGTNASFVSFLEQLSERHEVTLVTFRDPESAHPFKAPKGHRPVENAELKWTFNRGEPWDKLLKTLLWIVWIPWAVSKLHRQRPFDVVYCDDSVPYYGFFTKAVLSRLWTRRDCRVVIRLGDLQSGYKFAKPKSEKPSRAHELFFAGALAVERFMWRRLDGVVAISNAFRRFLHQQGLPNVEVVRESINLPWFDSAAPVPPATQDDHRRKTSTPRPSLRQRFGIPAETPIVMFHGALLPCKGVETLIAAAERTVPYHPAVFVIAGGGTEEAFLEGRGRRLIEQRRLFFTGWYPHRDLPYFIREADVGVVMRSSNMANDFVVTTCLLEFWAARKPVLAPRLAAFREVIEEGVHAHLFEPDDVSHLTTQLQTLLTRRELWPSLGERGRQRAEELFAHDHIAQDMVTTLEKMAQATAHESTQRQRQRAKRRDSHAHSGQRRRASGTNG